MNEHESAPADSPQSETDNPYQAKPVPSSGGMSPLRIVLLLILALMIVALAWDWGVARPASEEAYATVSKMVEESQSRPAEGGQAGPEDVQKALGRTPSATHDKGHYIAEEYHWIRGLPFKTYYITVIYNKREDKKTNAARYSLANVEHNQPLEDISEPGVPVTVPPELRELPEGQPGEADPAQTEGEDAVSPPVDTPAETPAEGDKPADEPAPETPAEGDKPADEPAPETSAEEPAPDAPAPPAETPAETPAPETPAPETPAEENPPAPETPPAEETPEAPAAPESPPAEETPAEEPAAEESADSNPPAEEAAAEEADSQ